MYNKKLIFIIAKNYKGYLIHKNYTYAFNIKNNSLFYIMKNKRYLK